MPMVVLRRLDALLLELDRQSQGFIQSLFNLM